MALAVEGAATFSDLSTPVQITTGGTDRIVVLAVCTEHGSVARTVSSVTSSGLTWAKRSSQLFTSFGHPCNLEVWWAYAAAQQTAENITVTFSGAPDRTIYVVKAISGATNFTAPWDGSGSFPDDTTGLAAAVPASDPVSTQSTNTVVLAWHGIGWDTTISAGSGYTLSGAFGAGFGSDKAAISSEHQIMSSVQTNITVDFGGTTSFDWAMITDAIRDDSGPPAARSWGSIIS